MGAGPAAGDAGLRHGLRLRRPAAVRRPGADGAARGDRLDPPRLLVPRHPQPRRRGRGAVVRALSVRLPAGADRLPGARRDPARRRPRPRPDALAQLPARLAAAGPAGDRRRRRAGPDGDAGRLRHGLVLRRADLHHRDLSRLVRARRPHGGGAALDGPARLRRRSSSSPKRLSRGGARFAAARPSRRAVARHPAGRLARRARGRRLRAAARGRLRRAVAGAAAPRRRPRATRSSGRASCTWRATASCSRR